MRTERISEGYEKCKTQCPEGDAKINYTEKSYIRCLCYLYVLSAMYILTDSIKTFIPVDIHNVDINRL